MTSKLLIHFSLLAAVAGCGPPLCGPGIEDVRYDVAGNYRLCRTSADQIQVVPLGGCSKHTPIIPAKVVEIAWDRTFVLGKQQHLRRRSPDNPADTCEEPAPGQFSYWILDTSIPKAFGPFQLEDFNRKRAEMKISDNLRLRDVNDFRP